VDGYAQAVEIKNMGNSYVIYVCDTCFSLVLAVVHKDVPDQNALSKAHKRWHEKVVMT
jgi:hypothetical protein